MSEKNHYDCKITAVEFDIPVKKETPLSQLLDKIRLILSDYIFSVFTRKSINDIIKRTELAIKDYEEAKKKREEWDHSWFKVPVTEEDLE